MRRFYSWICQHWGCLCSPGSEYPHLEFPRAGRIMGAQSCSHLKSPEPRTLGGRLQPCSSSWQFVTVATGNGYI
uniref:Uncharacterized protein n=1 Tax=Mus musculus TaxID=10090 RepID=Q3TYY9_MOUSE|nr:unnamed protein product [Mus musculus]